MSYKILIVDDEAANLRLLERLFRQQYETICAASGAEALELLQTHDIALIVSDQRMPGMTGIEFLKQAALLRPATVRIILTGYTDVNALVEAINSGVVYKYVTKPWANEDLQQTVKRGMQHFETIKTQHLLKLQNERLETRLEKTRESFMRAFNSIIESKDSRAIGHSRRMIGYAAAFARHLNLEPEELECLSLAAYLHRAAHIFCPAEDILYKTTLLATEDASLVKKNFELGIELLEAIPGFEDAAPVIRHQHEHWDGSGFPNGLAGEQIPLYSRIVAVADAYDRLIDSSNPEPVRSAEQATGQLQALAGKQFDPNVVKMFCELESVEPAYKPAPEDKSFVIFDNVS